MKTDLWKVSITMNAEVYKWTNTQTSRDSWALVDQLRRASLSVPTNIAEGLSRESLKDQKRFLNIAYASLMETVSLVITAKSLDMINVQIEENLMAEINKTSQLINGYRRYLNSKISMK